MEVIEQKQISRRFTRALSTYDRHAEAQQQICLRLTELLQQQGKTSFNRALEIGCGSGGFTRILMDKFPIKEWVINDLCSSCQQFVPHANSSGNAEPLFMAGDAEALNFPSPFDLIASASAFQWMKDQKAFLKKLFGLLNPNGILLFNSFTSNNLKEIRQLTGKGLDYPEPSLLREWIKEAGFLLLHEEQETITLSFDHPLEVLRHLKYTGVTATGDGSVWTRQKQALFCDRYQQLYGNDKHKVTLTYSPIYWVAVRNR